MESATIREVQHNLAAYLRRVEQGEEVEIRRRDKVIARLVSADGAEAAAHRVEWGEVREWRRRLWGDKPAPGKPLSKIVYDSRGER